MERGRKKLYKKGTQGIRSKTNASSERGQKEGKRQRRISFGNKKENKLK